MNCDEEREQILVLARKVVETSSRLGITIGTAESCTGGLVAGALTAIPGSSAPVRGGVVSYAVPVKRDVLGVSPDVLDEPSLGVVSAPCAEQMAEGACRVLGCDMAVSITGIAGPTGAEPGKPVGTIWFGLSAHGTTRSEVQHFEGSRDEVRAQAVTHALALLDEGLTELFGATAS